MPHNHGDSVLPPPSGAQSQPEDAQGVPGTTESPMEAALDGVKASNDRLRAFAAPEGGPPTKPPTPGPVGGHEAIMACGTYRRALADIRRVLHQPAARAVSDPTEWAGQLDQIEAIVDEAFEATA